MSTERSFGPRPSVPFLCLPHLLEHQASRIPDAPAILAPGRAPLTYRRLHQHVEQMGRTLRKMGIGRGDRVAVILPNGPEMAVAILSLASSATCVPMNPAYGAEELDRYFTALAPRALITQAGIDSPARRAAVSRGMRVIELSAASDAEAGLFALAGDDMRASSGGPVEPGDAALMIITSGTTARPKIVPMTHINICSSAYCSVASVALTENDRCINMMPLFHGHGVNNILLGSMAAGAGVVCTPGCDVDHVFGWLTEFRPTWYSAVPTMHQAIVIQARSRHERAADLRLRLVRSASASLPLHLLAELEDTFEAPVIEGYGMTESTSSPIASNPLPPRRRKPGSVGVPVGLDVAIMDERGALLPDGRTGEVVIRGASVTAGYDGDPEATAAAFAGDWFKTGDLGYFDDDGYLFLSGRIKEIVNRGGEKVSPQEVDEVLLRHPAVAQAVTFAVPHPTLGEDVASAIVLRPHAAATPKDIRQFAMEHIAAFKVPRQVVIVPEIPKGATGKVQRVRLAAELGLVENTAAAQPAVAPRTPLEKTLAGIWAEVLQVEQVGLHDDFFVLGGDSIHATRVVIRLHEVVHVEAEVSLVFDAPTVAEMAEHIESLIRTTAAAPAPSAIAAVPRQDGVAPASFMQERLWHLHYVLPDLPFFNVLYALRVTSACDAAILERSINEVVRRHEILRTTFKAFDGGCVQVIAPQSTVPLAFDDLRALPHARIETTVREFIRQELSHSFDLESGPLIRTRLVRLAERAHLLLINMSGSTEDGWSLGVLANELAALYDAFAAGRASPLAPLPIQYADFVDWQRRWRSHPDLVAQLAYWEERLRDPLPVMRLTRSPRAADVDDFTTARRQVALPGKLSQAARDFSQREGVTLFMTLAAALKTLLYRYTGEDDVRVATDVANRNHPQAEGLIGPVANTVILRTSLHGDPSGREVIRRVRATTLGALANQDLPFEMVVEALERDRAVEPAALAQVELSMQSHALRPMARSDQGLAFEEVDPGMMLPLVTMTTFDVILMLRDSPQGLVGTCVYKPHLFGAEAIDRLLRDFQQVLEHMIVQPEQRISVIPVSPIE
jgi:acyl-CoA synthetase (AMP-forming)/AMP-acid ligase II